MTAATKIKSGSTRQQAKKMQLIAMLKRRSGATIAAASEMFGWQQPQGLVRADGIAALPVLVVETEDVNSPLACFASVPFLVGQRFQ